MVKIYWRYATLAVNAWLHGRPLELIRGQVGSKNKLTRNSLVIASS